MYYNIIDEHQLYPNLTIERKSIYLPALDGAGGLA
jgi:hypothetical protein